MARGYPDYNNPVYALASKNIDFGLLAMAQMGIASIDNRGRIAWFENWREGSFAWVLSAGGDGTAPRLTTVVALPPPVSLELLTGTVGGGGSSLARHQLTANQPSHFGLEFAGRPDTLQGYITGALRYTDTNGYQLGAVRIYGLNKLISIYTPTGWIDLTALTGKLTASGFTQVKFTCNTVSGFYGRLIVGNTELDISTYALATGLPSLSPSMQIELQADPSGAASKSQYVGYMLYTTDEP